MQGAMKPKAENQGIKGKLNYARQDRYKTEEKKETKTGNDEIQVDKVRQSQWRTQKRRTWTGKKQRNYINNQQNNTAKQQKSSEERREQEKATVRSKYTGPQPRQDYLNQQTSKEMKIDEMLYKGGELDFSKMAVMRRMRNIY